MTFCYGLQSCFRTTESNTKVQEIRICMEGRQEIVTLSVILFIALWTFSIFSLIASAKLRRNSDNVKFYNSTKHFLGFDTDPVVHRSLVFDLAKNDSYEKTMREVAEKYFEMINRPGRGETPLHVSTKEGAVKCTCILLENGAELREYTILREDGSESIVPPPNVIELAVKKGYV